MVYQFLQEKQIDDLEVMDKKSLVSAYLSLQAMYNDLEDDYTLNMIDTF
jgi:hypothetical protein